MSVLGEAEADCCILLLDLGGEIKYVEVDLSYARFIGLIVVIALDVQNQPGKAKGETITQICFEYRKRDVQKNFF